MPMCQAYGCANRVQLSKHKGLSFFKIPDPIKNPALRGIAAEWLARLGTGHNICNFPFGESKVVCEKHFTEDCFTEDTHIRRARLLGFKPKYNKVLKPDAVPSIFVHKTFSSVDQNRQELERRKILLELLGPDYFDWRPKPRKSEPAAAPQGSNSSDQPIIKQEGPVVKQEGPVVKQEGTIVKQEGDTDHDYVVAVKVTDQLLGEAAQASVKEEPPESGYSVELLKSSVISQPPVVQTTVCMKNSLISQPPLVQTTVCTKNSVISQSPVVQTSVCTFPVLQLSTGQFASTSGQLGGIGKSRKSVVTNSNRQLHLLGACEVDYLVPEDTDDPLLVPEKVYTEVKYDYNELAHLWEQLPLESKQALAMADHRYLLTEAKQGTNLGGNSGVKKKTKMNRKLIGKYNPKTLKEMINVEGLPLYEDAPSLGEASPAEVTIRVYVEDEAQGAKKKKGKGKKRKGKAANAKGKPTSNNKEVEKDKDKIPHVCSAEKPSQDDDYEPLQLEVTAEEEMNERFAKGPEYRTEENAEPSVIEASREKEEMDVPEQEKEEEEEEEWDLEPSEDEFDYIDKKDDDYNPWSENSDSNSESEPGNASSSELDFSPDSESVPDSDSDSFADSVIKPKIQKEPVKEHQEAIPVAQRRSLRLRKKSKPDADVDQEEEQMDVTSQDGTDPKEEPATFPQTFIFPKKGYKCKYCDLTFRKKLRMKHHLHLTHLKTKYKPFKCSYDDCKRRFLLKKMLKQHIKNFHETVRTPVKKEFVCGFTGCNKVFRSKPRLNVHMQIHSETRDWVCKECGKTFKLQKCLSMHMKIHTGEKRLQCAVCGELFRQKASLNWHMTKHEESSDSFFKVSCEVCGKKFEKEKGREAHMLKVHGRTAV